MNRLSKPRTTGWIPTDAKWAFATRQVNRADVVGVSDCLSSAASGDLVLAKMTNVGDHKRIQLADGAKIRSLRVCLVFHMRWRALPSRTRIARLL